MHELVMQVTKLVFLSPEAHQSLSVEKKSDLVPTYQ